MAVETPTYEVLRGEGDFELRRYASYITANVRVSADGYSSATGVGFNPLANYIFGGNDSGERIAMTAPVTSAHPTPEDLDPDAPPMCVLRDDTCKEDEYVVSFTMPSSYAMDALPSPQDPRVDLVEVPSHVVAAVRFGGYLNERSAAERLGQLIEWIERQGLEIVGEPVTAQYDAPWKPGFLRRNEILVPVSEG